jgi:homoaconitase/3-isopropylmalate dehydratase large subunit
MNRLLNVTQKLITTHLIDGEMRPGAEIGLRIDQTLTQDATGTMEMLELEAMGLGKAQTEVSVQYVIGSSANPGLRDFWIVWAILKGRRIHNSISLDINPTSRQMMENLVAMDAVSSFYHAGGRIHQTGCMRCIGMGQAPATGKNSLRTVPRNFPGVQEHWMIGCIYAARKQEPPQRSPARSQIRTIWKNYSECSIPHLGTLKRRSSIPRC